MNDLSLPTTIACLTRAEARRDFGTNAHARRVAAVVDRLALQVGVSLGESRKIAHAAILHDIGKMSVPIDLLQKSTPLSVEEFALIKTHSQAGHDILATTGNTLMNLAADIALHHHEKYDGSGYPFGLAGDAIPLPAQILAICDTYDALRQDRPYRRGMTHDAAVHIIVNGDKRSTPAHFAPCTWNGFQQISEFARQVFDGGADA